VAAALDRAAADHVFAAVERQEQAKAKVDEMRELRNRLNNAGL
jgi:hypothetical protein